VGVSKLLIKTKMALADEVEIFWLVTLLILPRQNVSAVIAHLTDRAVALFVGYFNLRIDRWLPLIIDRKVLHTYQAQIASNGGTDGTSFAHWDTSRRSLSFAGMLCGSDDCPTAAASGGEPAAL